ncbi:hypothetical protein NDU88_009562 [Pleurodeles waltl]|uniref:Uncharacterized protein n=1 Tax=Pleurodeles waltl TaxID=8319 RepID=A0AAV7S0S9_PLEWA|nr:hypothetical protein NDU88_009562 [Pleurodeles waltl]
MQSPMESRCSGATSRVAMMSQGLRYHDGVRSTYDTPVSVQLSNISGCSDVGPTGSLDFYKVQSLAAGVISVPG